MPKFIMEKLKYDISLSSAVAREMRNNPQTDEGGGWHRASTDQVRKEMDPNTYSGTDLFAFAKLSWIDAVDMNVVKSRLAGKGTLSGTEQAFHDACKQYNVNIYYLIGQALIESGNGTSSLASGNTWNGSRVYNYFGIAAIDSNPYSGGMQYAYNHGWFTPELAIKGGAQFVAQSYINASPTQDTLYKYRYNIAGGGTHQYATDVRYPRKNASQIASFMNDLDITIALLVPEYSDNPLTIDIPEGDIDDGDTDFGGSGTSKYNGIYTKVGYFLYKLGGGEKIKVHFLTDKGVCYSVTDPKIRFECNGKFWKVAGRSEGSDMGGSTGSAGVPDGDLGDAIREMLSGVGNHNYQMTRPVGPDPKSSPFDCSGAVCFALRGMYPKLWNNGYCGNTNTLFNFFQNEIIKSTSSNQDMLNFSYMPGDILLFGASSNFGGGGSSHTGMMTSDNEFTDFGSSRTGWKTTEIKQYLNNRASWSADRYYAVIRLKSAN